MRLLCWAWKHDGLPESEAVIQRIGRWSPAAWRRIWLVVGPKWELRDGRLRNERQEAERDRVLAVKRAASASASGKWQTARAARHRETRSQRLSAARAKGTHTDAEWARMVAIYGRCLRCGEADSKLAKDHIVPIYQGGSDAIQNLQPLCMRCNQSKGPDSTDHRVGLLETPPEWLPDASGNASGAGVERLRNASYSQPQVQGPPPTPPQAEGRRTTRAERKAALRAVGPTAGKRNWRYDCPHIPECREQDACAGRLKAEHPDEVPA